MYPQLSSSTILMACLRSHCAAVAAVALDSERCGLSKLMAKPRAACSASGEFRCFREPGHGCQCCPFTFKCSRPIEGSKNWVPWGICAEGDCLYVAAATGYEVMLACARLRLEASYSSLAACLAAFQECHC